MTLDRPNEPGPRHRPGARRIAMRNWMMSAAAVGTLLAGPAAFAQDVNTDFDRSANFASYRTYAWTPGTPSPNPLGEQRIHAAVDQQLAAKGFSMVTESPSVYI